MNKLRKWARKRREFELWEKYHKAPSLETHRAWFNYKLENETLGTWK